MTYIVSGGALNSTHSLTHSLIPIWRSGSVVMTSVFGWQTFLIYARSMVDMWPIRGQSVRYGHPIRPTQPSIPPGSTNEY